MKKLKLFLEFHSTNTKTENLEKFVQKVKSGLKKTKKILRREPIQIKNWKTY